MHALHRTIIVLLIIKDNRHIVVCWTNFHQKELSYDQTECLSYWARRNLYILGIVTGSLLTIFTA